MYSEHTENINRLSEKVGDIRAKAASQSRALDSDEAGLVGEMLACIDDERRHLPEPSRTMQMGNRSFVGGQVESGMGGAPYAMVGPNDRKDYKSLFGNSGHKWTDKDTNFFSAVFSGRHHPGLITNTMSETVPSSGGFLVPDESANRIHAVSLESEIVQPRCYVQPMRGDTIKIPAMSIGAHGTNLFGGFIASYKAELGALTEANPKARAMELVAKKLTGLIRFSSELSADIPGGMGQIEQMCGKGLGFYRDKAFLKGIGSGEPLGILNSSCVVQVPKEAGQKKETICYENLTNIMARMFAGSFANSIWVCHQSTIPQLLSLSIAIGTGGSFIPVMSESNGVFTILTRPCIFTEKTESLGTAGDIMLADFSQYVVGLRQGMRFDTSIHVAFETDEILSRIIERHDGQPLWNEALTLAGGTTVSPFVTLADRLV
ncbi:MAG: phage major capsid protein [Pseudomonadota bacterium]|nr:phage major capsid protein [Pseudomonadota bacterium]